jgi:receptor-type tyrosine-protein phosphatase zeta
MVNKKKYLFFFILFFYFILEFGNEVFSINVQIESKPYWISKPKDLHITEGETVDFICNAESRPTTQNIQWFINGIPLQDISIPYNPRRRVRKNRMIIQDVTKLDTAVYQCNISNIHGYVFANFFVNVLCKIFIFFEFIDLINIIILLADKPEIKQGPEALYRLVQGQNVILPCEAFGAPMLKVYWSKYDRILTGGRYVID